jgi:hypothetical protein
MPARRIMLVAVSAAAALFASAPAADAATAEVKNGVVVYDVDVQNPFAQDLLVEFKGGRYVFTERGREPRIALDAKTGCSKDNGKVMSCAGTGVTRVTIETQLFDDQVEVGTGVTVPVVFSMGTGDDQAIGGAGADTFVGGVSGTGNDVFEGRGGDDVFPAGLNADVMIGGDGTDTADYSARVLRETVSLDDEANDGDLTDLANLNTAALSGADNVKQIENVKGGKAQNTLTGNDAANRLEGGGASDRLEGRGGADSIVAGDGDDEILARSPRVNVADPDTLISCGRGKDKVTADKEDSPAIAADCEDIDCGNCEVPPASSPPGTPSPAPEIAAIDPPGGENDADEGPGPGGSGPPPDPDGAGPQQAPPPLPPEVQIVSAGVVPLKANGTIPIRIFCIYRADHCGGSLTLKTTAKITAKIGKRKRSIPKGTTVSTADLAPIRWGNSEPVQMKASALFRSILPRLKKPRTKIRALLVSRDVAGGADAPEARATGDVTVAAKAARKRK